MTYLAIVFCLFWLWTSAILGGTYQLMKQEVSSKEILRMYKNFDFGLLFGIGR